MCRLFGAISSTKIDAPHFLHKSAQSLLRQSDIDRRRKQGDGWGIGYFDGGRPKILKSPRSMYRDRASVRRAAMTAKGKTLVGHVRWASNPLKLKRSVLIGRAHTQPFTYRLLLADEAFRSHQKSCAGSAAKHPRHPSHLGWMQKELSHSSLPLSRPKLGADGWPYAPGVLLH